jgi:hypothetical protein
VRATCSSTIPGPCPPGSRKSESTSTKVRRRRRGTGVEHGLPLAVTFCRRPRVASACNRCDARPVERRELDARRGQSHRPDRPAEPLSAPRPAIPDRNHRWVPPVSIARPSAAAAIGLFALGWRTTKRCDRAAARQSADADHHRHAADSLESATDTRAWRTVGPMARPATGRRTRLTRRASAIRASSAAGGRAVRRSRRASVTPGDDPRARSRASAASAEPLPSALPSNRYFHGPHRPRICVSVCSIASAGRVAAIAPPAPPPRCGPAYPHR